MNHTLKHSRIIVSNIAGIEAQDLTTVKGYISSVKAHLEAGIEPMQLSKAVDMYSHIIDLYGEDLGDNLENFDTVIAQLLEAEDDFHIELDGSEYRLINDDQIDNIHIESLVELLQELYPDASDSPLVIDWEESARQASIDGYGHHFASYDGEEWHNAGFYIFRTN